MVCLYCPLCPTPPRPQVNCYNIWPSVLSNDDMRTTTRRRCCEDLTVSLSIWHRNYVTKENPKYGLEYFSTLVHVDVQPPPSPSSPPVQCVCFCVCVLLCAVWMRFIPDVVVYSWYSDVSSRRLKTFVRRASIGPHRAWPFVTFLFFPLMAKSMLDILHFCRDFVRMICCSVWINAQLWPGLCLLWSDVADFNIRNDLFGFS